MKETIKIPCSPEQEDIIADHLFKRSELGILPDERAWIMARIRALYPDAKVCAADLLIDEASWNVTISRCAKS